MYFGKGTANYFKEKSRNFKKLYRMFNPFIKFFIPRAKQINSEKYRSARILVIVLLLTSVFNLLGIFSSITIKYIHSGYLLFVSGFVCLMLAFAFRNGLSFRITSYIFLAVGFVQIFLQAWWGGGLESPSTVALFLIPSIAVLLIGSKDATYWLVISIAGVLFLFYYEKTYGQLPELYDVSKRVNYLLNGTIGMMVCIFTIILSIDREKNLYHKTLVYKNEELRISQNRLILTEKLASLGELTAGIAHEIQNPLNFVTNFSELSVDLMKDIQEEMGKENIDKGYVKEMMVDLTDNQEKIKHHGRRASSIVKGMLEHSRSGTGAKQMTDVNVIIKEFLALSFHGKRAKEVNFYSDYKMDFDKNLPQINVVPQEIGRVLVNLFNNAFYTVHQRASNYKGFYPDTYSPLVLVTTKQVGNYMEIKVKDNGYGIPDDIKSKIFQPFFTTKPTGEGTGLGLSLAYDIITKGHGGTLEVESKEGEGSEFIIHLPFKTN